MIIPLFLLSVCGHFSVLVPMQLRAPFLGVDGPSLNPGPNGLFPSGADRAGVSLIRSAEGVGAENGLVRRAMEAWRTIENEGPACL